MLKLDLLNKEYTLPEIINIITEGNISNFKYDKEFLDFIISWSLGKYLEGPAADNYKGKINHDGLFNLMRLDEYDYFGKTMYKIYEICGKDKMEFIKVCDLIGKYSVMHRVEKNTIDTNLKLQKPVSFIDDSIILKSGKKPIFKLGESTNYNFSFSEEPEFNYELERSLRHRINESIKENADEVEPLKELPTYEEYQLKKQIERNEKKVSGDYEIDINNLYFGIIEHEMSGGVLGLHMSTFSWLEYMDTKIMNYYVFRSIPLGNFYLTDEQGNVHHPEKELNKDTINNEVNPIANKLEIINIPNLFKEGIIREEEKSNSELTVLQLNGLLEQLENNEKIPTKQLEPYEPIVRYLFDEIYENTYNSGNKQI